MAEGALRVSDLLPDRLDRMGEEAKRKLCENDEIGCMKLAWDFIASELRRALKEALDCELLEVVAKRWAEAELLVEHSDLEKYPPGKRWALDFCPQELSYEVHPVVSVTVGACPCTDIEFTLAISGHLSGLRLFVEGGHIIGGSVGEGWASAELSYGGVALHGPAETKKRAIPGRFAFAAPGLKIPRRAFA